MRHLWGWRLIRKLKLQRNTFRYCPLSPVFLVDPSLKCLITKQNYCDVHLELKQTVVTLKLTALVPGFTNSEHLELECRQCNAHTLWT
jgi:hypothetical protein